MSASYTAVLESLIRGVRTWIASRDSDTTLIELVQGRRMYLEIDEIRPTSV